VLDAEPATVKEQVVIGHSMGVPWSGKNPLGSAICETSYGEEWFMTNSWMHFPDKIRGS